MHSTIFEDKEKRIVSNNNGKLDIQFQCHYNHNIK